MAFPGPLGLWRAPCQLSNLPVHICQAWGHPRLCCMQAAQLFMPHRHAMRSFVIIWVLTSCCAETVVAITVAILLVLFSLQRYGTGLVGGAFAPILLTWLLSIAAIGLVNALTMHPGVFAAVRA